MYSQTITPAFISNGLYGEQEGHLFLHTTSNSVKYTVVEDGFLCPYSGTGSYTAGYYTGGYEFYGEPLTGGGRIRIFATDT
jgi:hypothetical protein